MSRKSSLHKVVEKNRENYGVDLLVKDKGCDGDKNPKKVVQNCESTLSAVKKPRMDNQSQDYEMKLRM